jgi:hypothetical protein
LRLSMSAWKSAIGIGCLQFCFETRDHSVRSVKIFLQL